MTDRKLFDRPKSGVFTEENCGKWRAIMDRITEISGGELVRYSYDPNCCFYDNKGAGSSVSIPLDIAFVIISAADKVDELTAQLAKAEAVVDDSIAVLMQVQRDKVALEADNQRLREALEKIDSYNTFSSWLDPKRIRKITDAVLEATL